MLVRQFHVRRLRRASEWLSAAILLVGALLAWSAWSARKESWSHDLQTIWILGSVLLGALCATVIVAGQFVLAWNAGQQQSPDGGDPADQYVVIGRPRIMLLINMTSVVACLATSVLLSNGPEGVLFLPDWLWAARSVAFVSITSVIAVMLVQRQGQTSDR